MNTGDWTAIGAMATAVMAIATFLLALKTWSMSKATEKMVAETKAVSGATLKEARAVEQQTQHIEEQVKISSDALRVSVQPWLIWVPRSEGFESRLFGDIGITVPVSATVVMEHGNDIIGGFVIRNAGTGIALIDLKKSSIVSYSDMPLQGIRPSMESPVIPPGEVASVKFKIPGTNGSDGKKIHLVELVGGGGSQTMWIEIAYSDVLGAIAASAKLQMYRKILPSGTQEPWHIIETTYLHDGREPISVRSV